MSFCQSSSKTLIPYTCLTTKYLLGIFCLLLVELSGTSNELTRNRDSSNPQWEYYRRQHKQFLAHSSLSQSQTFPKFYSPSLKITVQKGDRILLPCVVDDLGDDHIIWRFKTNILAGSNISTYSENTGRIRLFQNFTLEISNVSDDDEGEYECLLASPLSSLKLTHWVYVQDAPTVAVLPAKGSIVCTEGETVQIGCIPQGKPIPKITWTKRDGPLPQNYQKLLNESIITMDRVSRHHTGLYVCNADNGVGLPAIGAVYIRVHHTPEVTVPQRRVHTGLQYKIQLISIIHADPKPTVQWYLGQNPVQLSERVFMEARGKEHSLIVTSVRESDFGMYMVSANNSLGYDLKYIELTGSCNPPVVSRWESSTRSESAFGLPNKGETSEQALHDQNSDYNKTTRNFSGFLSTDVQVQLYWGVECYSRIIDYRLAFRPAPSKPLTSNNEDEKIQQWTELSIPADHASTFLHSKTYIVRGLQRDTIYEAVIKARNRYGWSPISALCYFATFPNTSSNDASSLEEYLAEMEVDDGESELDTRRRYLHPYWDSLGLGRHRNTSSWNAASMSTNVGTPSHHHDHQMSIVALALTIIITFVGPPFTFLTCGIILS